jgi:hypothetical protein
MIISQYFEVKSKASKNATTLRKIQFRLQTDLGNSEKHYSQLQRNTCIWQAKVAAHHHFEVAINGLSQRTCWGEADDKPR